MRVVIVDIDGMRDQNPVSNRDSTRGPYLRIVSDIAVGADLDFSFRAKHAALSPADGARPNLNAVLLVGQIDDAAFGEKAGGAMRAATVALCLFIEPCGCPLRPCKYSDEEPVEAAGRSRSH